MTDICAEGGNKAREEYLNSSNPFTQSFSNECGDALPRCTEKWINMEKYCQNDSVVDYVNLLKRIITECPDHDRYIDLDYYEEKSKMFERCTKDSVTGKICSEVERGFGYKYSEWDPKLCESSCVENDDLLLREVRKLPMCTEDTFISKDQPFCYEAPDDICGNKNLAEINKNRNSDDIKIVTDFSASANSTTNDTTSDATTLTSHIALFSLIMCLIFAFMK